MSAGKRANARPSSAVGVKTKLVGAVAAATRDRPPPTSATIGYQPARQGRAPPAMRGHGHRGSLPWRLGYWSATRPSTGPAPRRAATGCCGLRRCRAARAVPRPSSASRSAATRQPLAMALMAIRNTRAVTLSQPAVKVMYVGSLTFGGPPGTPAPAALASGAPAAPVKMPLERPWRVAGSITAATPRRSARSNGSTRRHEVAPELTASYVLAGLSARCGGSRSVSTYLRVPDPTYSLQSTIYSLRSTVCAAGSINHRSCSLRRACRQHTFGCGWLRPPAALGGGVALGCSK